MGIRFGWLVILVVGLAQAAFLVWGGHRVHEWLGERTTYAIERQAIEDNQTTAGILAQLISSMNLDSIEFGGPGWHRLQSLVETTRIPNGGFVTVVSRESGQLLSHPDLRRNESLLRTRPGQVLFRVEGKEGILVDLVRRYQTSEPVLSGYIDQTDGVYLAAATTVDNLDAVVIVQQSIEPMRAGLSDWLSMIEERGGWLIGSMAFLTMLVSSLVLWGFSSQLPRIQDDAVAGVEKKNRRLIESREAVIFALAKMAEARDSDTGDHLDRVRFFTDVLARQLQGTNPDITQPFIDDLSLAAALHDIGKAGIPDAILLKPGRLTEEERRVVQKHSLIGGACLAGVLQRSGQDHLLQLALDIATYHHERWDGAGYPTRRSGEDIPLAARIVALADVYDALTSQRPYKPAMTHEQAKEIILAESGKHFDPQVVEAFLEQEAAFEQIRLQYQNNNVDVAEFAQKATRGQAQRKGASSVAKRGTKVAGRSTSTAAPIDLPESSDSATVGV
ncbi:MAG: HD domain-containing protein [Pirellulales bacterium]